MWMVRPRKKLRGSEAEDNVEGKGEEEDVMEGVSEAKDNVDGKAEEVGVEAGCEGDDDFEVTSWTESEGEVTSEDELFYVRIKGDELEDELYDVRIERHKVDGASGCSRTKSKVKDVYDRGLSDTE